MFIFQFDSLSEKVPFVRVSHMAFELFRILILFHLCNCDLVEMIWCVSNQSHRFTQNSLLLWLIERIIALHRCFLHENSSSWIHCIQVFVCLTDIEISVQFFLVAREFFDYLHLRLDFSFHAIVSFYLDIEIAEWDEHISYSNKILAIQ